MHKSEMDIDWTSFAKEYSPGLETSQIQVTLDLDSPDCLFFQLLQFFSNYFPASGRVGRRDSKVTIELDRISSWKGQYIK